MRPEKEAIVEELRARLEERAFCIFVDYRGLTVEQFSELRAGLRGAKSTVQVVKNAFLQRAAGSLGLSGASDFLDGPAAMVTGADDVTVTAKMLKAFIGEHGLPTVKGGWLGDKKVSAGDIQEMAEIPPREVVLARFAGTVAAPLTRLVGVMGQKLLSLVYVLKAVEKNRGEQ